MSNCKVTINLDNEIEIDDLKKKLLSIKIYDSIHNILDEDNINIELDIINDNYIS